MNILVTGAGGQLGRKIGERVAGSADRYIFTDVCEGYERLDITDMEAVREAVRRDDIKCVINCAAWTDVEAAETGGEMVMKLNAEAPENLARAMHEVGGMIVHVSTDYVFGGEPYNTPCREDQQGTPTGVYGMTKLEGERRIMASGADYVIIRTAWLYSEYGRNFVKTMLRLTAERDEVKVVIDQCGTPTYAGDLASVIVDIVSGRKYESHSGVYHYSNEGVCSWFDFAVKIAELAGHDGCRVMPCRSDEFPSAVRRPAYSVLDKKKICDTFGVEVPYWTHSLAQCVRNLKEMQK